MGVHFARVQLVCECGGVFSTRQRGNTTKHRACGTARYVPFGQTWEGPPPRNRTSVVDPGAWLLCGHCRPETFWEARARPGSVVKCPECKRPKRVPTDPVVISPGAWDRDPRAELIRNAYEEQGGYRRTRRSPAIQDDPEGERAALPLPDDLIAERERRHTRQRAHSGPAHADRERERQARREQARRERERPRGDSVIVALARLITNGTAGTQPQPARAARPRPTARPEPAQAPRAPIVARAPSPPAWRVHEPWAVNLPAAGHVPTAEYLRKIGAPLSTTSGTHNRCQFHSLRTGLPCTEQDTHPVMVGAQRVGACADHARIAAQRMAQPRPRG